MKALSIRQPWASRILRGQKTVEVRSWSTRYRGPLLICATQRPRFPGLPSGVVLGVVDLLDCRPMTPWDEPAAGTSFVPGSFAWLLGNVRALEPFAIHGRLGLFDAELPTEDLFRQ